MRHAQKRGMLRTLILFLILCSSLPAQAASSRQTRINELLAKRNYRLGPNCWNATFYVTGHYPHLLFMTSIQATNLFDSSCSRLPTAPPLAESGIVNRQTDNDGRELHAAIKVGPNRYFQKRGYAGASEPYEYGHLDDILETDWCKKEEGCELIQTSYSCPAPKPSTEPLNPLELKINFLARQVSNLIFDARNPKYLIDVRRAAQLLDSTLRYEDLDSWIRGASKTNLLMLADVFQSAAALTKPTDYWADDKSKSIPLTQVLAVATRLMRRAERVRYFTPYERVYFDELYKVVAELSTKP